ncbi:MAG: DUF664 domain-containing protein [Candidatus Eisenbacteria bacterium]
MSGDAPAADFGRALVAETKRRLLGESFPRLRKCLDLLDDKAIWRRPNPSMASVGNLTLHVLGNARQWFVSGLLGEPDDRDRTAEFAEPGPLPREELFRRIAETERECRRALEAVDPGTLLETRRVQVFEESGLSVLVHVVEHFSYHVGQIARATKAKENVDLEFYGGIDLEVGR